MPLAQEVDREDALTRGGQGEVLQVRVQDEDVVGEGRLAIGPVQTTRDGDERTSSQRILSLNRNHWFFSILYGGFLPAETS